MSELELKIGEEQNARMKVGSQIVEHLSKGLYNDPAKAIRELISNSFDAEALNVIIRAKPELDRFSITDDGNGMKF
jgi:HSP90 family molecular chaperone